MQLSITVDDLGALGRLTKPFLYDQPLANATAEIERAIAQSGLFEGQSLQWLFLIARLARRGEGSRAVNAVVPDASWKQGSDASYTACFDADLAGLPTAARGSDPVAYLRDALALLRALSVQATAQVAVELGAPGTAVDAFLAGFPDLAVTLLPKRKARAKSRRREAFPIMLDVEVLHDGGSAAQVLARRTRLRQALEDVLAATTLGTFDGSSSGETHFEFGFKVADAGLAMAAMREALERLGVRAGDVCFEVVDC